MINKKNIFFLLLLCSGLIAFTCKDSSESLHSEQSEDQDPEFGKEQILISALLQNLQYLHHSPQKLDDSFSEKFYNLYLKKVDNDKSIFTKEDIYSFSAHKRKIDDQMKTTNFDFFNLVQETRAKRLKQIEAFSTEILASNFNFEIDESIETDEKKLEFSNDDKQLKNLWRGLLKSRYLVNLQSKIDRQEKAIEEKDTSYTVVPMDSLHARVNAKIQKQQKKWFKYIFEQDREDHFSVYLNTITAIFDPHTEYFPPIEKQNFDIRMSGKLEGIGAQLSSVDGYTKVVKIVAGSASARQGQLEVDDKIIKVAQEKDIESVDIVDMRLNDVVQLIRGEKGTKVRLTVKKKDGTIKEIIIVRDVVVLEETYAKSAIIKHDRSDAKIGLIDLRSFYADFENPVDGRRCSKDVKAEIKKLINENVDGILIDLRFNGGGSLHDVKDMTGYFIPEGPVVQVKQKQEAQKALYDTDPELLYDGPLAVLVNGFSASASEILAAALQDYGRAVIIGSSPSTFGKGTVQSFFSLDRGILQINPNYAKFGQFGSVKITTQKFYRINGSSTQLKGVVPDIILPGIYSYIKTGEKDQDYPLPWTTIQKSEYKENDNAALIEQLKTKSKSRIDTNSTFSLIQERAEWIKSNRADTEFSLKLETYQQEQEEIEEAQKKYENMNKAIPSLQIESLKIDKIAIEGDTVKIESAENWHKKLKKDPYIEEALFILDDWN